MDKKEVFFQNLQKQLLEWNEKCGNLESRLIETGSSLKTDYGETIEIIHPETKLVEMRMAELRESGEEARDDLRHGLEKAIKDLKEAYLKASVRSHLELDKSFV